MSVAVQWARRLAQLDVLEGVGLNDDFTDRTSDVPAILAARRPAWVGLQEGKNTDYADLLEDARYGVEQRLTSPATMGVALVYDRHQVRPVGTAVDQPRQVGRGYQQLTPAGHGILARGVVWQDVCVRGPLGRRRRVRIASTHRHPARAHEAWGDFDRALDAWLAASPLPVWLVADFNQANPRRLRFRGRKRLHRIDGHLITGALRFAYPLVRALKRRTSDHRGAAALVRIPRLPRRAR